MLIIYIIIKLNNYLLNSKGIIYLIKWGILSKIHLFKTNLYNNSRGEYKMSIKNWGFYAIDLFLAINAYI